jgi:single-strand DNA-binding protein
MALNGDTYTTVVGNLVDDPELRFTPSGAAVANFRIASTPRTFDRQTNEWKDGEALFLSCSVWRQAAENVAESLTKGMRVVVHGRLKQRSYEDREGQRRTVVELEVEEVGPSLKYATAKVTRASRGGGGGGGGFGGGDDPWNNNQGGGQASQGNQAGWGGAQGQGGQGGGWQSAPQGAPQGGAAQGGGQAGGQDPWANPAPSEEPPF